MKSSYVVYLLALVALVHAQSAPQFPIKVDSSLAVEWTASSTRLRTGTVIERDNILEPPTIFGPASASNTKAHIAMLIDQDVDSGGPERVQLLHYFQPNLVGVNRAMTIQATGGNSTVNASIPSTEYLPPTPPGGDGPHRYTILLFEQPADFAVPSEYASFIPPNEVTDRFPFDIAGFVKAAGLDAPIGANWFEVLNGTAEETQIALTAVPGPTGTMTPAASSSAATATSTPAGTTTSTGGASTNTATAASTTTAAAGTAAATSSSSSTNDAPVAGGKAMRDLVLGLFLGAIGAGVWMW